MDTLGAATSINLAMRWKTLYKQAILFVRNRSLALLFYWLLGTGDPVRLIVYAVRNMPGKFCGGKLIRGMKSRRVRGARPWIFPSNPFNHFKANEQACKRTPEQVETLSLDDDQLASRSDLAPNRVSLVSLVLVGVAEPVTVASRRFWVYHVLLEPRSGSYESSEYASLEVSSDQAMRATGNDVCNHFKIHCTATGHRTFRCTRYEGQLAFRRA